MSYGGWDGCGDLCPVCCPPEDEGDHCVDCCAFPDMVTTDDNEVIYPELCSCICHTRDEDEWNEL